MCKWLSSASFPITNQKIQKKKNKKPIRYFITQFIYIIKIYLTYKFFLQNNLLVVI